MFNNDQPTFLTNISRIIIIGDIHGDIQRFMNTMYALKLFDKNLTWIAEPRDTVVVQMGDQIDSLSRGPLQENWEILPDIEVLKMTDHLDNIAKVTGGRVLSLLGNHEIMNVFNGFTYVSENSLNKSGGAEARKNKFSSGGEYSQILARRNVLLKINNFLFCHAGVLSYHLNIINDNIHYINDLTRKFLRNQELTDEEKNKTLHLLMSDNGILWTRLYVTNQNTIESEINDVLNRTGTNIIFVGHNTVENILPALNGKIIFTDAQFSRAYPGNISVKIVEVNNANTQNLTIFVHNIQV